MEGRYRLVGSCKSRQLLTNLASPSSSCRFYFQALTSSESSSARQIFSLKSAWMNSKISPLALKRMSLNSTNAVAVHSVLNSSHGVISPTYIIKGCTS